MTNEEIVSFETAKLAKEKGFIHMKANCYGDNMCYQLPEGELINAINGNIVAGYILAPTQSLLQKWLRDVHDIYVEVLCCTDKYNRIDGRFQYAYHTMGEIARYSPHLKEDYEEALEAGLQEALELL